jgi:predicted dithiol-disulfide oxidoreductase (DUF899 family)
MHRPDVVSEREWQAARDALLVKEKALTHQLDALAAERRRLPMVRLDADRYVFTAPDGSPASLTGLFDGQRQLVIYHFMLEPGEDHVCGGCSTLTDNFDSQAAAHLQARDTRLVLMSRAPQPRSTSSASGSAGRCPGTPLMAARSTTTWGLSTSA